MAKQDTGTLGFALKNFWVDYVGWGRARRSEYWWVFLFYSLIIPFTISFICNFFVGYFSVTIGEHSPAVLFFSALDALVSLCWSFATMIGGFCLAARRLHDTNRSNWNILWALLPIVGWIILLIFLCSPGDTGKNRFGEPRM